jgi:hypothetical protein
MGNDLSRERSDPPRARPNSPLDASRETVLRDKLGERLAFERGSAELYESLLIKFDTFGSWEGGPKREELEDILRQELAHVSALARLMDPLDGGVRATPLQQVLASGPRQVLSDPEAYLVQCLEAILVAELSDNDGWLNLVRLALAFDEMEIARQCEEFLAAEDEHLLMVREWLSCGLSLQAFGEPWVLVDVGSRTDSSSSDLGPPAVKR